MRLDDAIRQTLAVTPECPDVEQLEQFVGRQAAPVDLANWDAHHAACAHCQAEAALLASFESAEPDAAERADTEWIMQRLTAHRGQRSVAASAAPFWSRWFPSFAGTQWPAMAAALAVLLIAAGGVLEWRRGASPAVPGDSGAEKTFRAASPLEFLSPQGDVSAAPEHWSWKPAPYAVRYEITVREVDRTIVWQTETLQTSVAVDAALRGRMVRLKPFIVQVQAFNIQKELVADSGPIRVRVQ